MSSLIIEYTVTPKLSRILKDRNITQVQLAELTGITQASISRFDRNRQHLDVHLIAISRALNIAIEDLFDINEEHALNISTKDFAINDGLNDKNRVE